MKDRTPKFPGRVKLDPVAGQTNTYDMTRADDPDDTGTPFNTRTMLQDSTARFLRIPVSNPFVDDALRHMPDRINPIGTIRTSPALSLGDAWLPCDGSQVTFAEYPALCQLLRGVTSTEWSGASFGVSGKEGTVSPPLFFDGRWVIALLKPSIGSGTNYSTVPLVILSAPSLEGPWTEEYTVNRNTYLGRQRLHIACSDEKCVVLMATGAYGNGKSMKVEAFYCSAGGKSWQSVTLLTGYNLTVFGFDEGSGTFAFAANDYGIADTSYFVYHSSSPEVPESWQRSAAIHYAAQDVSTTLTHVNGRWVLCAVSSYNNSDSGMAEFQISVSADESGFSFETKKFTIASCKPGAGAISQVVFFNGKYYFLIDGYVSAFYPKSNVVLAASTDLKTWNYQVVGQNNSGDDLMQHSAIATNGKILAFANRWHTWTTADPETKINEATLPAGSVPEHLIFVGDTAYAVTASSVAYHDYSTETRLLPTISMSDDTTTFIKAKNELDVFEAGGA